MSGADKLPGGRSRRYRTPGIASTGIAVATAFVVAVACGGTPSVGFGGPVPSACYDYFDAAYVNCGNLALPPDELAHVRGRYGTFCAGTLGQPGTLMTQAGLEACAQAIATSGCAMLDAGNSPCAFKQGLLPYHAPCAIDYQCKAGLCLITSPSMPTCGNCAGSSAPGVCTPSTCGKDMACVDGDTTCVPVTYGDAGASCLGPGSPTDCKAGLRCDGKTLQCSPPLGVGAPCQLSTDCMNPLVCNVAFRKCEPRQQAGAPCGFDSDCVAGLGCEEPNMTCVSLTWVAGGQPCGGATRCLVGTCPLGGGTCPTVVPDGQPCPHNSPTTCDWPAECLNYVCQIPATYGCQ